MNDEDQSGEDKSFLARWSQRKREAKQLDAATPSVETDVPCAVGAEKPPAEQFDLSLLPKLEDLTATTDITVFLREGVPESLRNAALRKFWALDPAIRNYVNPALEYAYDWNTPGGVPGSSEIGIGVDVARLVSQIMGSDEKRVPQPISAAEGEERSASASDRTTQYDAMQELEPGQPSETTQVGERGTVGAAGLKDDTDSAAPQPAARRHGSARPLD
jgi:uncharacterized protein DUF3306